jgi:asparagine synthase (glutamine-hydrolysing)
MSQFLLAYGAEASELDIVFRRGLGAFSAMGHGGCPRTVSHTTRTFRLALFGRESGDEPDLVVDAGSNTWAAAAGTLFYDRQRGKKGLTRFLERWRALRWNAERALDGIDGSGALLFGNNDGACHMAVDRLGNFHVYTARTGDCHLASSSALTLARLIGAALDPEGCRHLLGNATIYGQHTLFTGVRKVMPGRLLSYEPRGPIEARYWRAEDRVWGNTDAEGGFPRVADALVAAVETALRMYPETIVDLTGGYDSRGVLAAVLATHLPARFIVNGPVTSPDVRVARNLGRRFGLSLEWNPPSPHPDASSLLRAAQEAAYLTDGQYDVLLYEPVMRVHRASSRSAEASMNGSNGEMTKGIWYEIAPAPLETRTALDCREFARRRLMGGSDPSELFAVTFSQPLVLNLADLIEEANQPLDGAALGSLLEHAFIWTRTQSWQGRVASSTQRIWPVVSPYMFREVIEACLATSPAEKRGKALTRNMLTYLNPRVAAEPTDTGEPAGRRNLRNEPRFVLAEARRISAGLGRRVRRVLGRSIGYDNAAATSVNLFWKSPEAESILSPPAMKSASLFKEEALTHLLRQSVHPGTIACERLGRLLSIELAARFISG